MDDFGAFVPIYLTLGTLSLIGAACVAITYRSSPALARDHSSRIILYITLCDLAYTLKFMVSAVAWLLRCRDSDANCAHASFHIFSDGCLSSLAYGQFTGMACISWNACWVLDFALVLLNPLRNTNSNRRWYHIFTWGMSLLTTIIVLATTPASDTGIDCATRSDATNFLSFDVPLYIYFTLATCSLTYAAVRLSTGVPSSRSTRTSILARHAAYVAAFQVLWAWPIIHHWVDGDNSNRGYTLIDAAVGSGQALIFAAIRLSEPGAFALFKSWVRRLLCCDWSSSGRMYNTLDLEEGEGVQVHPTITASRIPPMRHTALEGLAQGFRSMWSGLEPPSTVTSADTTPATSNGDVEAYQAAGFKSSSYSGGSASRGSRGRRGVQASQVGLQLEGTPPSSGRSHSLNREDGSSSRSSTGSSSLYLDSLRTVLSDAPVPPVRAGFKSNSLAVDMHTPLLSSPRSNKSTSPHPSSTPPSQWSDGPPAAAPVPGSKWSDMPVAVQAGDTTLLRPRSRSDDARDIAAHLPSQASSSTLTGVAVSGDEVDVLSTGGASATAVRPTIAPVRIARRSGRVSGVQARADAASAGRRSLVHASSLPEPRAFMLAMQSPPPQVEEAAAATTKPPAAVIKPPAASPPPVVAAAPATPAATVTAASSRPPLAPALPTAPVGWDVGHGLRVEIGMCMLSGLCQAILESEAQRIAALEWKQGGMAPPPPAPAAAAAAPGVSSTSPAASAGNLTREGSTATTSAGGNGAAGVPRRRDTSQWLKDAATLTSNVRLLQSIDPEAYLNSAIDAAKARLMAPTASSPPAGDDTFELTSFSDTAFALLRSTSALPPGHIVDNFDPDLLRTGTLRAHFSDGASSSFFCRSADQTLVLKTVSAAEVEELLRLLPAYSSHMSGNPDSFLCRFYGCYSLKLSSASRVYFILMGNVFPIVDAGPTVEVYDLKGSTVGRRARMSKSLVSQTKDGRLVARGVLFQDMEFRERYPRGTPVADVDALCHAPRATPARPRSMRGAVVADADEEDIHAGISRSRAIVDQLERDITLLASHGLMDYSLLLNIMPLDDDEDGDADVLQRSPSPPSTAAQGPSWLEHLPQLLPAAHAPGDTLRVLSQIAGTAEDAEEADTEPEFGITYRLSFNKATQLRVKDGTALVRAACALPSQIAAFGAAMHVARVGNSSTAAMAASHLTTAETATAGGGLLVTGPRASLLNDAAALRMTRWSPLAVSVCALGTDIKPAGAPPQQPLTPADRSVSSDVAIAAGRRGSVHPGRAASPHTVSTLDGAQTLYCRRALVQVGVIDILQTYDVGKRIENTLKTIRYAVSHGNLASDADISSVDPHKYAVRFAAFARKIFMPTSEGSSSSGGGGASTPGAAASGAADAAAMV